MHIHIYTHIYIYIYIGRYTQYKYTFIHKYTVPSIYVYIYTICIDEKSQHMYWSAGTGRSLPFFDFAGHLVPQRKIAGNSKSHPGPHGKYTKEWFK